MRKEIMALLVAAGVGLAGVSSAAAMPAGAAGLDKAFAEHSPIEKARVYCYNTETGQFLHWGPCGGPLWGGPHWGGPRWGGPRWGGPGWDGPGWHHRHHWD